MDSEEIRSKNDETWENYVLRKILGGKQMEGEIWERMTIKELMGLFVEYHESGKNAQVARICLENGKESENNIEKINRLEQK
ncbi:hypothetical protein JTB14_009405 [Gonioctena quinquepunctata]|nr:hypothetical protein JTB14_009405 [Gonioctena quinquepunctata]